MTEFVRAIPADLTDGDFRSARIGARDVLIAMVSGTYCAIEDRCSHATTKLSEGYVEGDEAVCPLHGGRFNLISGECTGAPASAPVETFAIRIVGDHVEVELKPPRPLPAPQFGPI